MSDLDAFQARIGYTFRDSSLLRLALTHPSVVAESNGPREHNQRLEFLGDAVLQLSMSATLYNGHPVSDEGVLTKARARLVNETALAERARALDLGVHLVLSRGEVANGGRERPSILADAFEALLGAIYLDGGFEAARAFVLREFTEWLADFEGDSAADNPKGELQELLQARSTEPTEYRLLHADGPDHDRVFECAVWHAGVELGRGTGRSKKAAETAAARAALAKALG